MRKNINRQRMADEWNSKYDIGAKVIVTKDLGEQFRTTTRSKAELLPSGEAVIWVKGITGCYLLSRVRPDDSVGVM